MLFEYPKSAAFGRVLPKSKIYAHAGVSSAIKELFIRQVEQIIWQFKLAPETINLPATLTVPEIQIFSITLKTGELKQDVLRCIDQAIAFPIFFELRSEGRIKPMAAFKRPSETVDSKWIVSQYFEAGWLRENTPRSQLPMVLNLEALYAHLLDPLMPYPARPWERLGDRVMRMERIHALQREADICASRLNKERQFNRKVGINAELRELKTELDALITPT